MQIEVYADVIFLINYIMDLLILYITGRLSGRRVRTRRLLAAALFGSAAYCAVLFNPFLYKYAYGVPAAVLLPAGAVLIAFAPVKIKNFAFLLCLAYMSGFALGGCAFVLYYFTQGAGASPGSVSVAVLVAASAAAYIALKLIQKKMRKNQMSKQRFYNINVCLHNASAEIYALADTGNTLVDPVSKTPVVVAEFKSIKKCLPDGIIKLFDENKSDDLNALLSCADGAPFAGRIRMIPFHSVGRSGVLIGFRPDRIEIRTEKGILYKNAVIGIFGDELSPDKGYDALMNPSLLYAN